MRRGGALLVLLAPWLGGCAATMRTGGTVRFDHVQTALAPAAGTLRAAPVVSVRAGRGPDAPSLEIAPQVQQGANAGSRLRATARWAGRGLVQPVLAASFDEGLTRASELAGDSATVVPAVDAVRSRQLRSSVGVRFLGGRRSQAETRLDVTRSEGLGASADAFPQLSSAALEGRLTSHHTRRLTVGAVVRSAHERVGDAPVMNTTRASTTLQWRPTRRMVVTGLVGIVASDNGARPALELGTARGVAGSGFSVAALLAIGPEIDRLNGSLTDRRRARVRLETVLVPRVSIGATWQESADLGGTRQSVVRQGDAILAVKLGGRERLEMGVARFQQYRGGVNTNAESRAFVQLTIAPGR